MWVLSVHDDETGVWWEGDVNVWRLPLGALRMRLTELATSKLITVSGSLLQVLTPPDKQLTLLENQQKTKDYHLKLQLKTKKSTAYLRAWSGCHQPTLQISNEDSKSGNTGQRKPSSGRCHPGSRSQVWSPANPRLELTDSAGNPSQPLGGKYCVHKCPITAHSTNTCARQARSRRQKTTKDKATHLPVAGVSTKKKKRQIEKCLSSSIITNALRYQRDKEARADLGVHIFKLGPRPKSSLNWNPALKAVSEDYIDCSIPSTYIDCSIPSTSTYWTSPMYQALGNSPTEHTASTTVQGELFKDFINFPVYTVQLLWLY